MIKHSLHLACLLAVAVVGFTGCSQDTPPYSQATEDYDPAMNQPDPTPASTSATGASSDDGAAANAPAQASAASTDAQVEQAEQDQQTDAGSSDAQDPSLAEGPSVRLTDAQWKSILSDQEFYVLRRSGTERAGTGRYLDHGKDDVGAYHCVGCGNYLYDAKHKFHSGCGWPSFNQEVRKGAITEHRDTSFGMVRTEMRCARCDGHLGHIFNDGFDQPTGLRHCVNGTALIFVPKGQDPKAVIRAHRQANADQ